MSQCEELWAQYVPVSGAVDPQYVTMSGTVDPLCPTVRNCGPRMPRYRERWTQYVPLSVTVGPLCPSVRNCGPRIFLGEAIVPNYLSQFVLLAVSGLGTDSIT